MDAIFTSAKSVCDLHMISCLLQFSFPKQAAYPNLWGFFPLEYEDKKTEVCFQSHYDFPLPPV